MDVDAAVFGVADAAENHLGHFALTGHLLPLLLAAEQPRVVTVTSVMHKLAVRNELTDFKNLPHGSTGWATAGLSSRI